MTKPTENDLLGAAEKMGFWVEWCGLTLDEIQIMFGTTHQQTWAMYLGTPTGAWMIERTGSVEMSRLDSVSHIMSKMIETFGPEGTKTALRSYAALAEDATSETSVYMLLKEDKVKEAFARAMGMCDKIAREKMEGEAAWAEFVAERAGNP